MRLLIMLHLLAVFALFLCWAAFDARRRGKSAVLLCLALIFFFPASWLAWLLFRPEIKSRPA
ncbi:MAG TPA: hypothetical protein VG672_24690 [Bryobacteraceae bacterium]|nr:hypothetical protein [Bryobacteraceae bacterium]